MPEYLDLDAWPRRDVFHAFRHFDKPYVNVCVQLDVTKLVALCKLTNISSFIAYHYLTLHAANEVEEFHYRLRKDEVLIHPVVHGGTTMLLPNDTFSFVYFVTGASLVCGRNQRAIDELSQAAHHFCATIAR